MYKRQPLWFLSLEDMRLMSAEVMTAHGARLPGGITICSAVGAGENLWVDFSVGFPIAGIDIGDLGVEDVIAEIALVA